MYLTTRILITGIEGGLETLLPLWRDPGSTVREKLTGLRHRAFESLSGTGPWMAGGCFQSISGAARAGRSPGSRPLPSGAGIFPLPSSYDPKAVWPPEQNCRHSLALEVGTWSPRP